MSRGTWNLERDSLRGLYRDRENGWIFGVCAGIADYANFGIVPVRIITVVCLMMFFVPTALIYLAATVLLREKPLIYAGHRGEYEFWSCRRERDAGSRS